MDINIKQNGLTKEERLSLIKKTNERIRLKLKEEEKKKNEDN